jgi:FlaA1/EpsC-like NDP-sugar epimerase
MATPVNRLQRAAFFFATYGVLAALSLWFAYELRFAGEDAGAQHEAAETYLYLQRPQALLWLIPLKVLLLGAWGQFRGVFYYFRLPDALRMGLALAAATALALLLAATVGHGRPTEAFDIPRGVLLVDFNLSLVLFLGFRVSIRALRERFWSKEQPAVGVVERIAIVGAGQAGAQLASELISRRGHGIEPVCFLDDDAAKHNLHIHGVPVIGAPERMPELAEKYGVTEIILALPATSVRRIREVSALASASNLRVLIVPSMSELAGGRVRASDIRPISVEDILGRAPAKLDDEAIDDDDQRTDRPHHRRRRQHRFRTLPSGRRALARPARHAGSVRGAALPGRTGTHRRRRRRAHHARRRRRRGRRAHGRRVRAFPARPRPPRRRAQARTDDGVPAG